MTKTVKFVFLFALVALAVTGANITQSFAGAPVGWVTDRYQPNVFTDIGTFQGRNNVLEIGISQAQGFNNRGPGFASTFYNTQGMQVAVSGGAGSVLSADLWVPESWRSESNGSRRSDIWGVMTDGAAVSDYPIIGFTNYGSPGLFRAWDGNVGWVNLSEPVRYGDWNTLAIHFTGSTFEYHVNGVLAFTDNNVNGSVGFSAMIMQAYNFNGDPSLPNAVTANGAGDYSAMWANSQAVPEPGTYALFGAGLVLLGVLRRRTQNKRG